MCYYAMNFEKYGLTQSEIDVLSAIKSIVYSETKNAKKHQKHFADFES